MSRRQQRWYKGNHERPPTIQTGRFPSTYVEEPEESDPHLRELKRITKLLDRGHLDQVHALSDTQSTLFLDYKGRKHLYLYSSQALILNLHDVGLLPINANTWTDISFGETLQVFTSGQPTPVFVHVRATDNPVLPPLPSVYPINLTQVAGATLAPANPVITENNVSTWLRLGQVYVTSAFQQIGAAAAGWYGISVFNPVNSGKNLLIFSCKGFMNGGAAPFYIFLPTTDPALGTGLTPTNLFALGSADGTTSATWDTAAINFPGLTGIDAGSAQQGAISEMLTNNSAILLPAGIAAGVEFITFVTNSSSYGLTIKYVRY